MIDEQFGVTTATTTGLLPGEYTLYFMPDQSCQLYEEVVVVSTTTGLSEGAEESRMKLYPTMVDEVIQLVADDGGVIEMMITDANGRMVHQAQVASGPQVVADLAPGTYLLHARQGERVLRQRFVKYEARSGRSHREAHRAHLQNHSKRLV